jgi:hypothetical protein
MQKAYKNELLAFQRTIWQEKKFIFFSFNLWYMMH